MLLSDKMLAKTELRSGVCREHLRSRATPLLITRAVSAGPALSMHASSRNNATARRAMTIFSATICEAQRFRTINARLLFTGAL
jgi:hypothetical protein